MKKRFFLPSYCVDNYENSLPFTPDSPWLAPLAGYSDLPFRLLCRKYGAAVCETEMVSAKGLLYKSPGTGELLMNVLADTPLVVQLFGSDPQDLYLALKTLGNVGYRWFDCNMGCSVPKVMRQGAGAALLREPERALDLARAMIRASRETPFPAAVGFKLRAGIDSQNMIIPDLALRLEDLGASWICLHPRFAKQGFSGEADWNMLANLCKRLAIPLIASGDLLSSRDGIRCLEQTGVATVMYARGALRNPAIFSEHLQLLKGECVRTPGHGDLEKIIRAHLELVARHTSCDEALYRMRYIVPRYVKRAPNARIIRQRLCECQSWKDFEEIMTEFFPLGDN